MTPAVSPAPVPASARHGLSLRMGIGLVAGALAGVLAHGAAGAPWLEAVLHYLVEPAGQLFLRLLFMLVIPLVVAALTLGVAGLGDVRALGRIGVRTLTCSAVVSGIAVLLGVALVALLRPGDGLSVTLREQLLAHAGAVPAPAPAAPGTGVDFFVGLVPANVVRAMADGDMLAVMVFAVLLGAGLALTPTSAARAMQTALEGLYDVVMRLLALILRLAPIAVACLMFALTARLGFEILRQLAAYVGVVVLALVIHQFGVYTIAVRWLGGMSPVVFFRGVREAMVTAFATASSNATLPTTLRVADEELRLPRHISRFVLTLGATGNQNGTALFEGVTVLFLAQFYGVALSLGQQLTAVGVCILGGIGTAGVPAGSLPVVAMILGMVGVPVEGVALILGVDRFLDMCRTAVNVTGDLAIAVVVARGEEGRSTARN